MESSLLNGWGIDPAYIIIALAVLTLVLLVAVLVLILVLIFGVVGNGRRRRRTGPAGRLSGDGKEVADS